MKCERAHADECEWSQAPSPHHLLQLGLVGWRMGLCGCTRMYMSKANDMNPKLVGLKGTPTRCCSRSMSYRIHPKKRVYFTRKQYVSHSEIPLPHTSKKKIIVAQMQPSLCRGHKEECLISPPSASLKNENPSLQNQFTAENLPV